MKIIDERVRAKLFYWAFKVGFLQLICKDSLIFKSSLELAFSIILKLTLNWTWKLKKLYILIGENLT